MNLSKTKRLALDAMLAAMYVVLSLFSINLPGMKITLDSLPILVGAALLGPLDGLAVGLIGSFLNQMITYGFTATTLLWIIPAGLRGLLVGLYAKHHSFDMTLRQTVFITIATALLVTALGIKISVMSAATLAFHAVLSGIGAFVGTRGAINTKNKVKKK